MQRGYCLGGGEATELEKDEPANYVDCSPAGKEGARLVPRNHKRSRQVFTAKTFYKSNTAKVLGDPSL